MFYGVNELAPREQDVKIRCGLSGTHFEFHSHPTRGDGGVLQRAAFKAEHH